MEIGQTVKAGGVVGVVIEIHETDTEKIVKVRTAEGAVAIITYYSAKSAGLDSMKLG
jgi:tRNA G18 (ribose-2'-O)-methylase SpoU